MIDEREAIENYPGDPNTRLSLFCLESCTGNLFSCRWRPSGWLTFPGPMRLFLSLAIAAVQNFHLEQGVMPALQSFHHK